MSEPPRNETRAGSILKPAFDLIIPVVVACFFPGSQLEKIIDGLVGVVLNQIHHPLKTG